VSKQPGDSALYILLKPIRSTMKTLFAPRILPSR